MSKSRTFTASSPNRISTYPNMEIYKQQSHVFTSFHPFTCSEHVDSNTTTHHPINLPTVTPSLLCPRWPLSASTQPSHRPPNCTPPWSNSLRKLQRPKFSTLFIFLMPCPPTSHSCPHFRLAPQDGTPEYPACCNTTLRARPLRIQVWDQERHKTCLGRLARALVCSLGLPRWWWGHCSFGRTCRKGRIGGREVEIGGWSGIECEREVECV